LAVGVSDINNDGFPDIYVSNDFHENDYLYINQHNGTFNQQLEEAMPHTSRFSMGNDIADINNDGWQDILTLDMMPRDERIIKTTAGEDSYENFQLKLSLGFHSQLARNALQLNRGNSASGIPLFSDIAPLAGVEATDWSWAPLLADFDNDGFKDIFIANGILGRPNSLDYISFISTDSAQRFYSDDKLIREMPSGKVPNFLFKNNGDLTFTDVSANWIGAMPTLSNGAAYTDLDNDGDLDLIVNNINEKAFLYRNNVKRDSANSIRIKLLGEGANRFGIGAKVCVYAGERRFYQEQFTTRGWLSSVDNLIHVGLGDLKKIDSLFVHWPDGREQVIKNLAINQVVEIKQAEALKSAGDHKNSLIVPSFKEGNVIDFVHQEDHFNAFNTERLIPHMISTEGPKISKGDINGDQLEDFFIGGASGQPGVIFIQNQKGEFRKMISNELLKDSISEDTGSALFDADGDGSLDLMVASGGQKFTGENKLLQVRLYLNDGKGNLKSVPNNLPTIFVNASCVKPADMDGDGDMDVFIGGRVVPGQYGIDAPSYIFINNGHGIFSDETATLLPVAGSKPGLLGMVTDASWVDLNKDNKLDMIVVGEWMPITILIQENGVLRDRTTEYGFANTQGWWNTLLVDDVDRDGDADFLVGNWGLNSRLHASKENPVSMFIGDIDNNGSLDPILTYYNHGTQYPFSSRDQLVKQVPSLRLKFLRYSSYENVSLNNIMPVALQKKSVRKDAVTFASVYVENIGNGKFEVRNLPTAAQLFPIYSFCLEDINSDSKLDMLAVGNLYAVQPDIGRLDAGYGLALLGDGKGNFKSLPSQQSGFVVTGEGRDIQTILNAKGQKRFLVSRNNESIKVFQKATAEATKH
jgi:hypothetical protein